MKAELTDGRIVDLDGYCQCGCGTVTIPGPCWLRIDRYDKENNAELLDMAERQAASAKTFVETNMADVYLRRHAELEVVRLDYKKRNMERHGIVRLIEEDV